MPAMHPPDDLTPSPTPPPASHLRALLSAPGFRWLMLYRISTLLCYQIIAVAVGWQVYALTRNPFSLGLIGLAEVLPFFCLAPFAGHLSIPCRVAGWAWQHAPCLASPRWRCSQ